MKIKTSELTDIALDWAVAKAQGIDINYTVPYSSNWMYGGPIIERERIDCISDPNGTAGWMGRNWVQEREIRLFGATPLIAAMRCFVASKLGDEVEIPEELT